MRPNLPKKLNGAHCEKMNIKNVVIYTHMPNYSLFEEFQIVGPNLANRMINFFLRNRHWIYIQHNTSNSCTKFHLISRIIIFGSKFAQKLLQDGTLGQPNQRMTCF